MKKLFFTLFILFIYYAFFQVSRADEYISNDPLSTRLMSMGMSGTAGATGIDCIAKNPACLSLYKVYRFEFNYLFRSPQKNGRYSLSIADSKTSDVAAGFSWSLSNNQGAKRQVFYFPTAYVTGAHSHFGTTVKWFKYSSEDTSISRVTLDAGMVVSISKFISIGAAGYNLIDIDLKDTPLSFSYGLHVSLLGIGFDLDQYIEYERNSDGRRPWSLSAGAEYVIDGVFPIRAGYKLEGITKNSYITFGSGIYSGGLLLEIGMAKQLKGDSIYISGAIGFYL